MFLDFYKKNWKGILNILLFIFSLAVFLFAFKQFYTLAGSVIFGLIFFAFIEPFARFLNKHGVKKALASIISGIGIVLIFISLFAFFGSMLVNFIIDFSKSLPHYTKSVQGFIDNATLFSKEKLSLIPPEYFTKIQEAFSSIIAKTSLLIGGAIGAFVIAVTSSFSFFTNIFLGYIFAIMLSIDSKDWKRFTLSYAPSGLIKTVTFLKDNVLKGISSYIIAQTKLISITFVIILIALLCLQVENAFMIAFIGAIFDILPLLGVSTVFVPWIIYLFIKGNIFLAVSLTVVLVIVLGTRQVLEPKITGDSLGVNASVMFLGFILSTSILGFWGIFLSPILIVLIKELIVQGYLDTWFGWKPKTLPEEPINTENVVPTKKDLPTKDAHNDQ